MRITYRGKLIPGWFIGVTLGLQLGLFLLLCWVD